MRNLCHPSSFLIALFLPSLLVACGGGVDAPTEAAGGQGAAGASGVTGAGAGTSTTSASASSGAGGQVDPGPIAALQCAGTEGVIVAAGGLQTSRVAVRQAGTWVSGGPSVPPTARGTTYVDVYADLGVFWTPTEPGAPAQFLTTADGVTSETRDVTGWQPLSEGLLLAPGLSIFIGTVQGGTGAAYFDPDAFDWNSWLAPQAFVPSSAATNPTTGSTLLVALGGAGVLCDLSIDNGAWGAAQCHDDHPVASGGEIPLERPQVVALAGGPMVAFYYTDSQTLAAVTWLGGTWSPPREISSPALGVRFAATATPDGAAIVGVISTSGVVSALRFDTYFGWGQAVHVADGIGEVIAAAPGNCGDDALLAFATQSIDPEIQVARIQAGATETTTVTQMVEAYPSWLSVSSRGVLGE